MMQDHVGEEDLILMFYEEPSVPRAHREHVQACPECSKQFDALQATLRLADQWVEPEPEAEYERTVWAQLVPQLEPRRKFVWFADWRLWTAAAVLLVAVFFAGRMTRPGRQVTLTAGLSDQARERILAISIADHLERTGLLLTAISNVSDTLGDGDRERARDLVSENRLMRQVLERRKDRRSAAVLDELEPFLIEIANAPDHVSHDDLREWQLRIESNSLLFKVRVTQQNLQTEVQNL